MPDQLYYQMYPSIASVRPKSISLMDHILQHCKLRLGRKKKKKKTLTVVLCSLLFVGSSRSSTTSQRCYSRWFQCSANTLVIVLKTCNGQCETCSLKENKRFIIHTIPEHSSSTHSLPRLAHGSSITFLS